MMHSVGTHLPAGWSVAKISEIAEVNPRLEAPAHAASSTVSFVPMTAVEAETGAIDLSRTRHLSEVRKGYRYFRARDVLFAKITPCMENGKMVVVPRLEHGIGFGSTEFHVLRPHREISPDYLYRFVSAAPFRRDAGRHMTGAVGQRRVPTSYLGEQPIPIPPATEQRRIATKIEELFSELEKGIESLKNVRDRLATYRQAVLKHAFEGKLTAQWREHHRDIKGAKELRQNVLSERRYGTENSLFRRSRARGRPHHNLVYRDSVKPIATDLPTIPGSWCWATVGQILSEELSNGRSVKSAPTGFPVLRLTALRNGEIEQNEYKIGAWTAEDAEPFLIREGDFLVSRGNGSLRLVGRGGLVRSLESPVAYPDTMIRLRISRYVDREFFCYVWNSRLVRRQIETIARTTAGIFKVNQRDLEAAMIPLPPIEEQYVITEEVRCQLAALDHTMGSIDWV